MRALLVLAFALVLAVVVCSATLRLAGSGIGCTPWPACYAQASATTPSDDAVPEWQHTLRLTHRISATAAGLVFVFVVTFGFAGWSVSQRVAGVSLLALAAALAMVGRITPSPLPAVVLANLLGGHLLLAALGWLLVTPSASVDSPAAAATRGPGWLVFAGALLLTVSGNLVSVHGAAAACADGCSFDPTAWLQALAASDPWRGSLDGPPDTAARQPLLQMHAMFGSVMALVLALVAWRLGQRRGVAALAATTATAATTAVALGCGLLPQAWALPAATAHSVLGGLTAAGCAALWRAGRH